jgi:lipopolysaccharide heptosyltransferase II
MRSIPMQRLQRADQLLGRLACALLQPLRWLRGLRRTAASPRRVLVIKFWGVGSLQLLSPATRFLRRRHPQARLDFLTLAPNAEFARALGLGDEVLTLDVAGAHWLGLGGRILRLVRELRRRDYDVVYDFEFFTRFSALVALLSGAPEAHGFFAPSVWRGGFHTHTAPFNRYWHVARNFRSLAGGEDGSRVEPEDQALFPTSSAHEAEVDEVLAAAGLGRRGPLVALNPNAGSLSLERRWPQGHFAELARRLVLEDGVRVVLTGAASERAWTAQVAARVGAVGPGHFADLCGHLGLGGLQALFDRCAAVVSNDSGPMHLAAARGVPTIGLFGPETPVMYAPLGTRTKALYRPPACSPCINVHDNKVATCVRGRPECLMNISVDEVLAEVRQQLAWERLATGEQTADAAPPTREVR